MAQQTIDIGAAPNDGTGDPLRDAFDKANDNFDELYARRRVIAMEATQHAHTGDTSETTLLSVTIPAGSLGPNGQLIVESLWSMTNNANVKVPRMKFGGTNVFGNSFASVLQVQEHTRLANRNSVSSQVAQSTALDFGTQTGALVTLAIDTSVDVTLLFTGQLTNSGDTIALESVIVETIYGA